MDIYDSSIPIDMEVADKLSEFTMSKWSDKYKRSIDCTKLQQSKAIEVIVRKKKMNENAKANTSYATSKRI